LTLDHTAVNIDSDGFDLALSQQLFEDLEINFPQHLRYFGAEVPQKS